MDLNDGIEWDEYDAPEKCVCIAFNTSNHQKQINEHNENWNEKAIGKANSYLTIVFISVLNLIHNYKIIYNKKEKRKKVSVQNVLSSLRSSTTIQLYLAIPYPFGLA